MASGNLEEITFMFNQHASHSGGVLILLSLSSMLMKLEFRLEVMEVQSWLLQFMGLE